MRIGNNINTESFRFNFFLIYIYSAIISFLIIIVLYFYINNISKTNNFYSQVSEPMVYQAHMCNVDINRHASLFQSYLKFGNEEHKAIADERLFEQLPERISSIVKLSEQWDRDPTFKNKARSVRNQLYEIQKTYKKFDDPEVDKDQLLNQTYLPMLIQFGLDMKEINNYHFDHYGHELTNIFKRLDEYMLPALWIVILLFTVLGFIINRTRLKIRKGIDKLQATILVISEGNIPEKIEKSDNELIRIEEALISLVGNLENVKTFAEEVGKGVFDSELSVFHNEGDLGKSLSDMRDSLKLVADEGKIRDWTNAGLAKFATIIQDKSNDLNELTDILISELVKYTNSIQGGIFIVNNEDEENIYLELFSSYAYSRKKHLEKQIEVGEGYIGQVYLEKKAAYLRQVPDNFVTITSGLGQSNPNCILIEPMIANENVEGIVELVSFNEYPEYVREFVAQVCETIAASISTVKNNANLNKMMSESQVMTEQLKSQEEELRQNTEELQATQEDMERRIHDLEAENAELRSQITISEES